MQKDSESNKNWRVSQNESGLSLIQFLSSKLGPHISARQIKRELEHNACTINGRIERFASKKVGLGDSISYVNRSVTPQQKMSFQQTDILYEDKDLVVYNKPAGVSSTPEDLLVKLLPYFASLYLVHRLDRDTTGILLLAKNKETLEQLENAFRERKVKKTYLAIVDGYPEEQGIIDNHLAKVHTYQGQAIWGSVEKGGVRAITAWKRLAKGKHASLIECYPETGRTHQIRVHCSGIGHPILGDVQYGKRFTCTYKSQRTLLHASAIEFFHPHLQKNVKFQVPIPLDFQEASELLKIDI